MKLLPSLALALVGAATAVEKLDSNQVEARKLRVYDFSCPESEKHVCACQLRCENPKGKTCQKGIDVCAKHAAEGCAYVVTNPSGEWATLKRKPTATEMALCPASASAASPPDRSFARARRRPSSTTRART